MRLPALVILALTAPGPSVAQTRPQTLPTRDVMVQYVMTQATDGTQIGGETWFFSTAAQTFRIEGSRGQGYSLLSVRDQSTRGVDHQNRQVVKLEPRPNSGSVFDPASVFTRLGSAEVAGRACTNWRITGAIASVPPIGQTVCFTPEGVMLRRAFGTQIATATAVTNLSPEQQSADRFTVPAEYRVVTGNPPAPPAQRQ